jgi:hypothetical protein
MWRYQNWFPSPVVYVVQKAVKSAFANGMQPLHKQPAPVPRAIQVLAGVLMLASLIGALWRTRQTAMSKAARIAWIVACLVLSVPALMALWLLYPKRETVDAADFAAQPAIA